MTSFVLSHADMVLPIRQSLAEQAISMGANPDHVSVIPHGIDMTPFRSQHDRLALCRELEIDPEKKIISFAGRLSKENYLPDIVKAIKMLSEKRQDFLLVIFGDGDWRESLMSYLKKYPSLQKVIRFYGFQPQKKSYRLRHISDVSLCLMGGFSLIEACASGSPVVAYDVEWHHELIVHRENGILISEGNIQQLALEVEWLLDHSDEAQSFGKKAQEQVMKKHDIFHTSKIKIENYKKILPASS